MLIGGDKAMPSTLPDLVDESSRMAIPSLAKVRITIANMTHGNSPTVSAGDQTAIRVPSVNPITI